MIRLDEEFLADVQLDRLPPEEANLMLSYIYETLESRVGVRLASAMSEDELDEFEVFIKAEDEESALRWLESHYPNYKDAVRSELELIKAELRQVAPTILAKSGIA